MLKTADGSISQRTYWTHWGSRLAIFPSSRVSFGTDTAVLTYSLAWQHCIL